MYAVQMMISFQLHIQLTHARSHLFSQQPASGPDELSGAAAVLGVRGHKLQEGWDVVSDGLQELRVSHDPGGVRL